MTTLLALRKRPEATRPATKASVSEVRDTFLVLIVTSMKEIQPSR